MFAGNTSVGIISSPRSASIGENITLAVTLWRELSLHFSSSLLWILTCFHCQERLPGKVKMKKYPCRRNLKIQKVLSLIHLFWLNLVQYLYIISLWKSSFWFKCPFESEFYVLLGGSASLCLLVYQLFRAVTWWLQGQFRLYHFDQRPKASKQTANYVWFVRRRWLHAES